MYRARDTRLGREVAVKVLSAEFSADADRRSRFEQEARSASALNHPNIVTIYEIGSTNATTYIAMELVDGKTLREVLEAGPLPNRRLLDLAFQMADALAKAHSAGIVHRDLKPENVMVSRDGTVKMLDFGLAKLLKEQPEEHVERADGTRDEGGHRARHGRLHVARAGERQAGGLRVGSVRARIDLLRDGHRPARLPARHERGDADRDHPRGRRAGRAAQRRRPGAVPLDHRALPAEGPPRALRLDARPRLEHQGRSRAPVRGRHFSRCVGQRGSGQAATQAPVRPRRPAAGHGHAGLRRRHVAAEAPRQVGPAVLSADHLRARYDSLGAIRSGRPDHRLQRGLGRRVAQALPQASEQPGLSAARAAEREPPGHIPLGGDGDRRRLPLESPRGVSRETRPRGPHGWLATGRGRGDPGCRLVTRPKTVCS